MEELVPWKPFEIFERVEDEAIVAEIRGEVIRDYVYTFTDSEGKTVEGLSKAGVDAVISQLAHKGEAIRELECQWQEDEDSYKAIVKAGRYAVSQDGREVLLDSAFGAKRQPKTFITKGGQAVENPFAFEQAIIKAARNAKRRLIPESMAIQIIELAKKEGKVRDVTPPRSKPQPSQTEEDQIKQLRQKLHLRWEELQKEYPWVGEKKDWLKRRFKVESSTELNLDQLKQAYSLVKRLHEEGAPTDEEKREVAKAIEQILPEQEGKSKKNAVAEVYREVTGRISDWTKEDMKKLWQWVEERRAEKEKPAEAEEEAEDFLKGFE